MNYYMIDDELKPILITDREACKLILERKQICLFPNEHTVYAFKVGIETIAKKNGWKI